MSDAFDYLILGGGLAGCRLAARLAEDPAVQVALLEAGAVADSRKRRPVWPFATEVQAGLNGRSVALPMAKCLGGGASPALRDSANAESPLLAAARQAALAASAELKDAPYTPADVDATPQALLARPNVRVITGAHVMRILLEGSREHLRAVGVEYAHEGYQKQLRAAREVLLCAGALQSPQILMLSGIGPHAHLVENGIGTRLPLPGVGQGLVDLPEIALRLLPSERRGVLGLARKLSGIEARPGATPQSLANAGVFIRSGPEAPNVDLRLSLTPVASSGSTVHIRLLHPHSRGRVRLDSRDPFEAPSIDPDLLGHREDMERLLRGYRLVRGLLMQPAMAALGQHEAPTSAKAQSDLQLEHFIRDHALPAGLPAHSCATGDGATAVVDAALRVHGVAGLRVVDASVLAEPTAMGALADQAAGWLRAAR